MEHGRIFQPPPFLGLVGTSNSQIRALKNNSLPHLASHRSLQPSSSHTSPSLALVTSRGTAFSSPFTRTSLTSLRRRHLRLCWDLLHVCIQRRKVVMAGKFLKVILHAHEWASDEGWRTALLLLSLGENERGKLEWLQGLDRESSSHFKAAHTTYALVSEYIAGNQLSSAIELLQQRVNVYPYRSRPELHCTLGMLYVMVGIQTLLNNNEVEAGVRVRAMDRATKTKAKRCFEAALQAKDAAEREEVGRRQRVYAMGRREREVDMKRVERGEVWGRNPLVEEGVDAWPSASAPATAAIGETHDFTSEQEQDEEEEMTPTPTPTPIADPGVEVKPSKGPKSWASVWPEVSSIYTPPTNFAVILAREFLDLLSPSNTSASQVSKFDREEEDEEDDGEEGGGVVDALELTREEAERRIRGILFEDPNPHQPSVDTKEKKGKRKHKHSHSHSHHKRRRRSGE